MTQAVDTAVTPVDSTTLEGLATSGSGAANVIHDMSAWAMFWNADLVVKSVMLMLIFASFWAWAIIFDKWLTFRSLKSKASRFENEFWSAEALDKFYERTKKKANHPMAIVFVAAVIGCAFSLRRVLRIDPASAIGSAQ